LNAFFGTSFFAEKISVINSWGEVVKNKFEIQNFQEKSKKKSGFHRKIF
jgi:hypothetical protein